VSLPVDVEALVKRMRAHISRSVREDNLVQLTRDEARALFDEVENGTCRRHANQKHGAEAEELRRGIERVLKTVEYAAGYQGIRASLQTLLDAVDARDSLAYLESRDEQMLVLTAALDEALNGWRQLTGLAGIPGQLEREHIARIAQLRALTSRESTALSYLRNEIRELRARVEERDREIARLRSESERQERMIASFQEASTFHGGPGE
jgi:hypothetical protein